MILKHQNVVFLINIISYSQLQQNGATINGLVSWKGQCRENVAANTETFVGEATKWVFEAGTIDQERGVVSRDKRRYEGKRKQFISTFDVFHQSYRH